MSLEMRKILIVEDEVDIADLLAMHLRDLGALVETANDGTEGLQLIEGQSWDIVILDRQLPGVGGLELCRSLRALSVDTAIILLTSRGSEIDRVTGLDQGADDYITKPFSIMEVIARIKAQCRKSDNLRQHYINHAGQVESGPGSANLNVGAIRIDVASRMALVHDKPVDLTAREFDLLSHFCKYPNRVFSRAELLDKVWGYSHYGYEQTVNSHINRLRAKVEQEPSNPELIVTVWGVGYKLQLAEAR